MKSAEQHKPARQHNKSNKPFFNKQGQTSTFAAESENELQTKAFFSPNIQPKLTIGAPDDPYEKEADRLAEKVIQKPKADKPPVQTKEKRDYSEGFVNDKDQMAQSPIQLKKDEPKENGTENIDSKAISHIGKGIFRKLMGIKPKTSPPITHPEKSLKNQTIQEKEGQEESPSLEPNLQMQERTYGLPQPGLETRLDKSKGGGQPLPEETKAEMEGSFSADFSEVRVHTDGEAEQMNQELGAQAFTHGADIYFNKDKYRPDSLDGKRLLAHELTHTLQQDAVARTKPDIQKEDEPTLAEMMEDLIKSNREQREAFDPSEAQQTRKEADAEGAEAESAAMAEIPEVVAKEPEPLPKDEKDSGPRVAEPKPKKPDKVVPSSQKSAAPQAEPAAEVETTEQTETAPEVSPKESAADSGADDSASGAEGSGTGEGAGANTGEGGEDGKGPIGQKMDEESAEVCNKGAEKAQELADNESAHDTAEEKAGQTDVAVEPPAEEGQSRSNAEQVNTLEQAEAPEPDDAQTKQEMEEAIDRAVPSKIKELNEFESEKRAQVIGNKVLADTQKQVGEVQGTYNEIEQAPPPAESETPVPLPSIEQAPNTPNLNLGKDAVPELQAEDVDMSEYENQADDIYEKEGISPDMKAEMENVDSGDIAEANKEKGVLKKKVAEEPEKVQKFAKDEKKGVEKDLQQEEAKGKASMKDKRKKELEGAKGKQEKTKTEMEKKREEVTNWINNRYETAKTTVTDRLAKLEEQALKRFDTGQKRLSVAFEKNVKRRVNRWKDKRYGGFWGPAKWLKDKFVGIDHFQEIKDIFSTERAAFVRGVDRLIVDINKENEKTIQSCKDELAKAKKDIAEYVEKLGPALKDTGLKAQQETDKKLAELDEHIEKEKKKLQQKLCDAKEEAIKAIDKKIEKMKSEMSGLVSKLGALLLYAAKKFFNWVIKKIGGSSSSIMKVIDKGVTVLKAIFTDPIGFFKNLGKAVGGGIKLFVTNIVSWLKKGLISWLMGAMGDSGLELPEKFNLKGILFLGLQVVGLTWNVIRARLVKRLGPKGETIVGTAEKGLSVIQRVRKEGPIALWHIIVEKAGEIKSKVMEGIRNWAITKIIQSATIKLISMLNPAGAIFQAIKLLYDTVMFFVENWQRIVDFVNAIFDSIGSIAKGAVGAASKFIEKTLGLTIPMIISFLARFIGLSGISKAIKNVIKTVQKPFKKVLDKIIGFLVKQVKKIFKGGKKVAGKVKDKILKWWNYKTNFKDSNGKQHKVYFKGQKKNSELTVESTPISIEKFLANIKTKIDEPENKKFRRHYKAASSELKQLSPLEKGLNDPKIKPVNKQKVYDKMAGKIKKITGHLTHLMPLLDGQDVPETILPAFVNGVKGRSFEAVYISKNTKEESESIPESASPPGWEWLKSSTLTKIENGKVVKISVREKGNYVRMHLLYHRLGGKAVDSNLTPVETQVNNPGFFKAMEEPAKKEVDAGKVIWYKVNIEYHNDEDIPGIPSSVATKPKYSAFPKKVTGKYGYMEEANGSWKKGPARPNKFNSGPLKKPDFTGTVATIYNVNQVSLKNASEGGDRISVAFAKYIEDERRRPLGGSGQKRPYSGLPDLIDRLKKRYKARMEAHITTTQIKPNKPIEGFNEGIRALQKLFSNNRLKF